MVTEPRLDWLAHAAKAELCPLCLAVTRHESDALAALCHELQTGGPAADAFAAARGLCSRHTIALQRGADDDRAYADGVMAGYVAMLDRLITDLRDLEQDEWLPVDECPVCASGRHAAVMSAHRLLFELGRDPEGFTQALTRAGGLCVPHFTTCWEISPEDANRDRLRTIELDAAVRLVRRFRDVELNGDAPIHSEPHALMRRAGAFASGYRWGFTQAID